VPAKPQTRQAALASNEKQLLAEIEQLRIEVGRLKQKLIDERGDRAVQAEVHTVLSKLQGSPGLVDENGDRHLPDGRFIPSAINDGGTSRVAEPGAPRVTMGQDDGWSAEQFDQEYPELAPSSPSSGLGEQATKAFDRFFNAPDPHLDKIRQFLLD